MFVSGRFTPLLLLNTPLWKLLRSRTVSFVGFDHLEHQFAIVHEDAFAHFAVFGKLLIRHVYFSLVPRHPLVHQGNDVACFQGQRIVLDDRRAIWLPQVGQNADVQSMFEVDRVDNAR